MIKSTNLPSTLYTGPMICSHNDWNHYGSMYHGADGRYSKTMVDWSLMTGDDGTGDRAK